MAKTKSVDDAVMELLRKVETKKKEVNEAKKKPQWKTNCSIAADPDPDPHDHKNIQVMRTPREVIEWFAFLLSKEQLLQQAADELGLEPDLTWMAYPIADWKDDLKTRAGQLSIDQKEAEIVALDKRVNKLVSPEQRREMELKALQELLDEDD